MSWLNLNQSLNNLKGQITNFATEVLADGVSQITTDQETSVLESSSKELEEKCRFQELEIAALKKLTDELQTTLQSERLTRKNGIKEEESSWYWDPNPQPSKTTDDDTQNAYRAHIQALQNELSNLKECQDIGPKEDNEELSRLKEENKNLTTSLDDLDNQHQMAMERLLTLKKELQKNFEVLKQEHEELKRTNDDYGVEMKSVLHKLGERDQEIERLQFVHTEFETLHHKYQNLERVHSVLRENAEKFQEENQDLHEEVFKLQEQVTKLEHDLEVSGKYTENRNVVSRQKYDEVLQQLNNYKQRRDSNQMYLDEINIDDNAKGVIETLKRDISTLKDSLAQYEGENITNNDKTVKSDKIMQLYNKYINFDLPMDYLGEIATSTENAVILKLETIFKTVESFKKEIDLLQHELSEKNEKAKYSQKEIDELTSENEYLIADMQNLEGDLEEMKKNNEFLISEIAALKNSSKLEPIIETHEDNLAKLETELADCNQINKTFESKMKQIEKELSIVKSEKHVLQSSLDDMKNKYKTMLNDIEICKTETKAIHELENENNLVQSTKLHAKSVEYNDLKRRLSLANSEKEKLSIDINIIENEKVLLTKEIDDLRNALEVTSNNQKELESMKTVLDHKLQELEIKLDDVLKDKENLEKENMELKENIKSVGSTTLDIVDEIDPKQTTVLEKGSSNLNNSSHSININHTREIYNELQLKCREIDEIYKEVDLIKEENKNVIAEKRQFEEEVALKNDKILYLENESGKLISELNEKLSEIERLNNSVSESKSNISDLSNLVINLKNDINSKDIEIKQLQDKFINVTNEYEENCTAVDSIREELKKLYFDKEEISKQLLTLVDEGNGKNNKISQLTLKVQEIDQECSNYKVSIVNKDKEIKELKKQNEGLENTIKSVEKNTLSSDICTKADEEKYSIELALNNLQEELQQKENNLIESQRRIDILENEVQESRRALLNLTSEKTELINLVNLKHSESIQYHTEIQRLNHILLEQTNEFKRIVEENKGLLSRSLDQCPDCERLRNTIKEKEDIIMSMNQNNTEYERLKSELINASEIIKNLTLRCEDLDRNLTKQLNTVKKVTAENIQLSETEQNSSRELERLRHHLVELEESYTQELMTSEQKLNECQSRLQQVEERAKQTSTVYTSNSIRANQEVETLRNQIRLLEKQRDDVQSRLSDAEDARGRSEAALTNLQIVLEQFQLDKEREINAATEKIRRKLEGEKQNSINLHQEIIKLNMKLKESIAGLQAATRLGDQVETKTAQINDLKEQVRTLHISVAAAEERYHNAISNQQDKVDKNLVKNLVVNYVMSGQNYLNRTQVLRVLSTVLDFNQQECEKLGLIKPAAGESLAAEFVRFLQDESKPRPPQPSLVRLQTRTPSESSRKTSTSSQQPVFEVGHSRNPSTGSQNLLFQNIDSMETASQRSVEADTRVIPIGALETGINQTRNNEGAILKNVLKDL